MKKAIIVILCVVHCVLCFAMKVEGISDSAKFYLVTCEPGDAVYARFGHSGLRVYDAENNIDEEFHWGLFSFDTPNFIGRFISGNTDYEMGVFGTRYFMREYIERGSSVYAQELDLTSEQKQELWAKLWTNYHPDNRKYRYNFIYDNCATRPYQLITSTYDYKVSLTDNLQQTTYRNIINQYIPIGSILNTGINLIIGSDADKYIKTKESVAFPMYTMDALMHTNYITTEGLKPIVKGQEVMHNAKRKNFEVSQFVYYISIILPLLLVALCGFYTYKKKRYVPYFTQIMLLASGLVGIVICYLWFCSHHPLVDNNINILWLGGIYSFGVDVDYLANFDLVLVNSFKLYGYLVGKVANLYYFPLTIANKKDYKKQNCSLNNKKCYWVVIGQMPEFISYLNKNNIPFKQFLVADTRVTKKVSNDFENVIGVATSYFYYNKNSYDISLLYFFAFFIIIIHPKFL